MNISEKQTSVLFYIALIVTALSLTVMYFYPGYQWVLYILIVGSYTSYLVAIRNLHKYRAYVVFGIPLQLAIGVWVVFLS